MVVDFEIFQMTPERIGGVANFTSDILTGWREGQVHGVRCVRDAGMMVRDGLRALRAGLVALSNECFNLALPKLLEDLGPGGPPETTTPIQVLSGPTPVPEAGPDAVAFHLTPGWDAMRKASDWNSVALCRWFLDSAHDAASLSMAVDEHARWLEGDPESAAVPSFQGEHALHCVAAGQDERCLAFLSASQFKPPARPSSVKHSRALAWVIAAHRARGLWTVKQMEAAFDTFFRRAVPEMLSMGAEAELATWMKVRYWDLSESKTSPVDAMMHQYDFLPGVAAPPLRG